MAPATGRRVASFSKGPSPEPVRRGPATMAFPETMQVAVAAVLGGAAAASGLVLVGRRLAGGFSGSEPGLVWIAMAAGIALVAAADLARRRFGGSLAAPLAARCGLMLGVAAVALPPRAGDWGSIIAVTVAAAVAVLRPPAARVRPKRATPRVAAAPASRRSVARRDPPPHRDERVPGRLQQRIERYETPGGIDCVRGRVQLSIPEGGRTTHAHVGFCPAFTATPSVEVSTEYDGVEAVVTAAEVLPWGVRVECRLAEPAEEPLEIPVDVLAKAPR